MSAIAFGAGHALGARQSHDPSLDQALTGLDTVQAYLTIATSTDTSTRAQREFDRHIGRALTAVENAKKSVNDAIAAGSGQ
jgi:hypothetical protein